MKDDVLYVFNFYSSVFLDVNACFQVLYLQTTLFFFLVVYHKIIEYLELEATHEYHRTVRIVRDFKIT